MLDFFPSFQKYLSTTFPVLSSNHMVRKLFSFMHTSGFITDVKSTNPPVNADMLVYKCEYLMFLVVSMICRSVASNA